MVIGDNIWTNKWKIIITQKEKGEMRMKMEWEGWETEQDGGREVKLEKKGKMGWE